MLNILLPVDGSPSALRATETLIRTTRWLKEPPAIVMLAVHLPVPRVPHMGLFVNDAMLEQYYREECDAMIAPSAKLLDEAKIGYTVQRAVGPVAESIVEQAKQSGSDMIYMVTRGMTALANMALGSIATRVLHLAHIPVLLVH